MKDAIQTARTIYGDLEGSMTDLAKCGDINPDDWDQVDAEADRMWNDPSDIRDIIGDRIFWACKSFTTDADKHFAYTVCATLIEMGHDAIKEAVGSIMEDHNLKDYADKNLEETGPIELTDENKE